MSVSIYDKFYIGTTRFNNETYEENLQWRKKHNHDGCIYALNKQLPDYIPPTSLVFVIEMNNDINKIMGIGLIRNNKDRKQRIRVYNGNPYYNRYVYHSKQRIEAGNIKYKKLLRVLELMLFKGSRHMKRGQGITCVPWKRFKRGETTKIIKLFFTRLFE